VEKKKSHWTGAPCESALTKGPGPFLFRLVLNAIVNGGEVVGATVGTGCNRAAEKKLRSPKLETRRKAPTQHSPRADSRASPPLVSILGYEDKGGATRVDQPAEHDPRRLPVLGRAPDDRGGGCAAREIRRLRLAKGWHRNVRNSSPRLG